MRITNKASGHTSEFTYDGLSHRVTATETDSGGTPVTTRVLWCGEILCEKRDAGDAVIARYYAQGELQNGQPLYYAQDQVGTVVGLVDGSGTVVGRLSYDSYGNIAAASGTLPDYRYAGLYYHLETGLYMATYRAYDAGAGRWLSRDPVRERGGTDLYVYVLDNPVNFTDQSGLLVGSIICQGIRRLTGQTAQEAAMGGKVVDAYGSAVITGTGVNLHTGPAVGMALDAYQGVGGAQTVGLSASITFGMYGSGAAIGSAGAAVILPLSLSAIGGAEIGLSINSLYERLMGDSIGGDIYDLFHGCR